MVKFRFRCCFIPLEGAGGCGEAACAAGTYRFSEAKALRRPCQTQCSAVNSRGQHFAVDRSDLCSEVKSSR